MKEKFKRIYETDNCVSTWTYDPAISTKNPVSVEHKWKNPKDLLQQKPKKLGDLVPKKPKKKT
jgi:hypothetical protein